jgi:hypothetical protein
MKKIVIAFLAVMLMASIYATYVWATAGACTESVISDVGGSRVIIKETCKAASTDGSVPNITVAEAAMNLVKDKAYLYTVSAYPVPGGTAPDAANVLIKDAFGEDLLGGTTANVAKAGVSLIDTYKKTTIPYSKFLDKSIFYPVGSNLTIVVTDQGTVNADFVIEMTFAR